MIGDDPEKWERLEEDVREYLERLSLGLIYAGATARGQRCPSCLKSFSACACEQRCELCGGLTNHTTAQHELAAGDEP